MTDIVIKVGISPPPILEEDPRALLYHSRNDMVDEVKDTKEARLRGWRRMTLFGLIFFPSGIAVKGVIETFRLLQEVTPEATKLGEGTVPINGGLYPWSWPRSEEKNFKALSGGLLVAPILSELILNREPQRVTEWVEAVSKWSFRRIIPCHFENDIKADGKQFKSALQFLDKKARVAGAVDKRKVQVEAADLSLLRKVSDVFTVLGIVAAKEI